MDDVVTARKDKNFVMYLTLPAIVTTEYKTILTDIKMC
jgi:hypothetical protein